MRRNAGRTVVFAHRVAGDGGGSGVGELPHPTPLAPQPDTGLVFMFEKQEDLCSSYEQTSYS